MSDLLRARELFDQLVELDDAEQQRRLAEIDDAGLRGLVAELLEVDNRTSLPVDQPIIKLTDPVNPDLTGERIGPFKLISEIGHGGMGTVYLAERADGQFEQQVAIKLLRPGLITADTERRFLAERQILARLNHPNIAQLIDGGVTPGGRPFFAMEYVDGVPITEYCDREELSVDARLELFVQVCRAVQYAQESLIVHRDLKPSNIMVTNAGDIKLLDFGIAKLIRDEAQPEDPVLTQTGYRVMTPAYAAPEQATGDAITTATDVYSLGVILYELVTGSRPPAVKADELVDKESLATRPSTAVTKQETEDVSLAGRAPDYNRLSRRLRGDVDTILLSSLAIKPDRRYRTAAALADDIQRHLDGRPITARRPSWQYQFATFVRRNSGPVALVATALVLVIALTVYYTVQLAQERDIAQQEAVKSAEVIEFLTNVFVVADPSEERGTTVTAQELLQRGTDQIYALEGQPEVQAELLEVLGTVHTQLGLYDDAGRLLDSSLLIRKRIFGEEHVDVARSMRALYKMYYNAGNLDSAALLVERTLDISREVLPATDPMLALTLNDLGWLRWEQGDNAASRALHQEALAIREAAFGPDHPATLESRSNLAAVYYAEGDYAASEQAHRELLEIRTELFGGQHPYVLMTMANLALTLEEQGEFDEAERFYRESLDGRIAIYGPSHPETQVATEGVIRILRRLGRLDQAYDMARQLLSLRESTLGEENFLVGFTRAELGAIELGRERNAEAVVAFRGAIASYESSFASGKLYIATARIGLAEALLGVDSAAAALPVAENALAVREADLPPDHPGLFSAKLMVGVCRARTGDVEGAEPLFHSVDSFLTAAINPPNWTAKAERWMAEYRRR